MIQLYYLLAFLLVSHIAWDWFPRPSKPSPINDLAPGLDRRCFIALRGHLFEHIFFCPPRGSDFYLFIFFLLSHFLSSGCDWKLLKGGEHSFWAKWNKLEENGGEIWVDIWHTFPASRKKRKKCGPKAVYHAGVIINHRFMIYFQLFLGHLVGGLRSGGGLVITRLVVFPRHAISPPTKQEYLSFILRFKRRKREGKFHKSLLMR